MGEIFGQGSMRGQRSDRGGRTEPKDAQNVGDDADGEAVSLVVVGAPQQHFGRWWGLGGRTGCRDEWGDERKQGRKEKLLLLRSSPRTGVARGAAGVRQLFAICKVARQAEIVDDDSGVVGLAARGMERRTGATGAVSRARDACGASERFVSKRARHVPVAQEVFRLVGKR